LTKQIVFFVTFNFPERLQFGGGEPEVHKSGKVAYALDSVGGAKQMHMACEVSQVPGRSLTTTTNSYLWTRETTRFW